MARENKLLKTLKKPAPVAAAAADSQFDDFLAKIKQPDRPGEKNIRLKPQSISLYPDDVAILRQLRRAIEDSTDLMNVPISAIYRAALHAAVLDPDKFVQIFQNVK